MEIKETILKYALQNAVKFNGKANPGTIIGKLLMEDEGLKSKIKELSKDIQTTVKEVNKLSLEEQKEKLKKIAPEMLEKKKAEKRELPELKNAVVGKVVTRIPPEPSKYNHIGHALSFLLNYLYAKKYKGKSVLRFEDTNPLASKQEYVDAMKKDVLEYLNIKPDKVVYVSDDMPRFYELAEDLIKRGDAYVCFCERDKMRDLRHKGLPCECRKNLPDKNLEEWKNMLNKKYNEGDCVLRLKIDLESDNHVMRDPVIFRLCYTEHYRQKNKYNVWPMYDFENAVEEEFCGVTHILRSSEFGKMRVELQDYIKDLFEFKRQEVIQYGRFNVVGAITQGREIRELISEKKVIGWDDPRLVTLRALKRRGIKPEMFYELALKVGLSKTPTNIDWSVISSINRKIVDASVNRYFFIENPEEITIKNSPEKQIKIKLHPEHEERRTRNLKINENFYISKDDLKDLKQGKLYRLMHAFNFKKQKEGFVFDSEELEKYKQHGEKIMHWLPKDENLVDIEVLMPDAKIIKGVAEPSVKNIKIDEVVQFERFGFCKLDEIKKDKLIFWYTHD
ncbi:MAG: glutamate--tRNA ligase [Candidatus Nanoarchaeia archaeon]|nr:glutamate--tRNA ligase [Candidatus Nanoarchaeia archaeon]